MRSVLENLCFSTFRTLRDYLLTTSIFGMKIADWKNKKYKSFETI